MGTWSYYHGYHRPLKNSEIKEQLLIHEFSGCKVHHISIPKWGEAYVAFSNDKLQDPNRIYCAVVKIAVNNHKEIGFKVMDEECHPYYYNCPKKILNMLSPTTNVHSLEWRKLCYETHTN
jgi:hypothetical protein